MQFEITVEHACGLVRASLNRTENCVAHARLNQGSELVLTDQVCDLNKSETELDQDRTCLVDNRSLELVVARRIHQVIVQTLSVTQTFCETNNLASWKMSFN